MLAMRRRILGPRPPRVALICATSSPIRASASRRAPALTRSLHSSGLSSRLTRGRSRPRSPPLVSGLCPRPITERWPKPVLPIDGRPLVATLVRELASAGCEQLTVVTGHLAEQVEALLGDGSAFGVRIEYVRQPRADGSADAVRCALAA